MESKLMFLASCGIRLIGWFATRDEAEQAAIRFVGDTFQSAAVWDEEYALLSVVVDGQLNRLDVPAVAMVA